MTTDQSVVDWSPDVLLTKAVWVGAFAVTVGVLLPLVVAWRGRMMTDADVAASLGRYVDRLEGRARPPVSAWETRKYQYLARLYHKYQEVQASKKQKEEDIAKVDNRLRSAAVAVTPIDRAAVASLIDLRAHLRKEIEAAKAPVVFSGYYDLDTMLLWPALYFFLGCLVFIVPPPGRTPWFPGGFPRNVGAFLGFYVVPYLIMHSPTLARNFVFYDAGRRVIAHVNVDVFGWGFVTQEAQFFVFAFLVVLVARQWMTFYWLRRADLIAEGAYNPVVGPCAAPGAGSPPDFASPPHVGSPPDVTCAPFEPRGLERLSVSYLHWQVASLLLALAFILDTKNFWDSILINGDLRYIPNAVIIHFVWVTVWIIVSMPVFLTWYTHKVVRDRAVCALASRPAFEKDRSEFALKALQELQPIGTWNLVATSLATLLSFAVPAVQTLLK